MTNEQPTQPSVPFKPNMYPIMYWALAYGVIAGLLLLLVFLLSQYITIVWLPVFLTGLVLGGYRNYQKQKNQAGIAGNSSAMNEFRQAVADIASASQGLMNQDQPAPQPTPPQESEAEGTWITNDQAPSINETMAPTQELPPTPPNVPTV